MEVFKARNNGTFKHQSRVSRTSKHCLGGSLVVESSSRVMCKILKATYTSLWQCGSNVHEWKSSVSLKNETFGNVLSFCSSKSTKRGIKVTHVPTRDQLADGFIKPLSRARFEFLQAKTGVTKGDIILIGCIESTSSIHMIRLTAALLHMIRLTAVPQVYKVLNNVNVIVSLLRLNHMYKLR